MKSKIHSLLLLLATLCPWWSPVSSQSVMSRGSWWRLTVKEEGMYSITTSDIAALRGVSTDSVAVFGAGGDMLSLYNSATSTADIQQVRSEVVDHNGNGLFDTGDELHFFGEGAGAWHYDNSEHLWTFTPHAYATANHYFVAISSGQAPLRIGAPDTQPSAIGTPDTIIHDYRAVVRRDNDLVNVRQSGQRWMGEKFTTALTSRSVTVSIPHASSASAVTLRMALANLSTSPAAFTVGSGTWSTQRAISSSDPYDEFTVRHLADGTQHPITITYHPSEGSAAGYLDYIELTALTPLQLASGQRIVRNDRHLGSTARYEASSLPSGARIWEVTTAGCERELALQDGAWCDSTTEARRYVLFDNSYFLIPDAVEHIAPQNLHGSGSAELVIVTHPRFMTQAQRLATLHELFDGITTLVVDDQSVYNEFSSGKQDPIAIRSFLRWLNEHATGASPRWLLLFGKGSYDPRDLEGRGLPTVVTYESSESFHTDGGSFASDDMMGYLAAGARGSSNEPLDIATGRLPASSEAEAQHMVDKIEGYLTRRDLTDDAIRGDWRNIVALLADDADPGKPGDTLFAHSSEVVAQAIATAAPQINVERYYADAYRQRSSAIGSTYPDLNNALKMRMNYGCLLLNYIGHGSSMYIGTERYIEPADVEGYTNTDRLPLMVTSTCTYGRYDMLDERCGGESCLLAPAGMIGVIAAGRPISHVERFNRDVVLFAIDPANTIGDALRMAKNRTAVSMCIGLLGDPALRLSQPDNHIVVTAINGSPVDNTSDHSAEVLSVVTISGEVRDASGDLIDDFDGTIYPIVYDRQMLSTTLANDNPGTELTFMQQKNILYRGSHEVHGGLFEYSFTVPRDVSYHYDYAKLSHYAKTAWGHATGSYSHLLLGGISDDDYADATPPTVTLTLGTGDRALPVADAPLTGSSPTLTALLWDSVGLNIGSGLGHDITATLDDNPGSLVVLSDLFQPDVSDSRGGSVTYRLEDLAPGRHTVTVKAWNIFGLSATATTAFVVRGEDTLTLSDLTCHPNPASSIATFTLRLNNPAAIASAEMQIYSSRGQLVHTCTPPVSTDGYVVGPIQWDVCSVAPGLYLVRCLITDTDGETHARTTKCIVR